MDSLAQEARMGIQVMGVVVDTKGGIPLLFEKVFFQDTLEWRFRAYDLRDGGKFLDRQGEFSVVQTRWLAFIDEDVRVRS